MATLVPGGFAPPNSEAQAQLNHIVKSDEAKNRVAVHTFDPNASPQEKAAAAGQQKDKLKSVKPDTSAGGTGMSRVKLACNGPSDVLAEVAVDTGHSNVVPTITVEDVDKLAAAQEPASAHQAPMPPGAMPAGPAPAIPDWYKIGWREVGGIDQPTVTEGEAKDKTVLDAFLKEQFYGDWYHNAALIVAVRVPPRPR